MNIILLSGGSGKRLWPLSNEIRSKQFIKIFRDDKGNYESMVQRVYRQIRKADREASIIIAASRTQISAVQNQLDGKVEVSVEPYRKDTFPAIVLAVSYLVDVKGINPEEPAVVCPVDPYTDDEYFIMLKKLSVQAEKSEASLVLMGIEPEYPSEKYGYIIPESKGMISRVKVFREKPNTETAKKYISQGALWNAGVFAFKLRYVLERAHEQINFTDYYDLFEKYETLQKSSFDYAVTEKEASIQVMRYSGQWKDIGTWNMLTEVMESPIIGDGRMDKQCDKVHIINELDIPILAMGMHDVIISASPEGILVSDRELSPYIKPYVEAIDHEVMFAEKSWGSYRVLEATDKSLTIKVTLKAGYRMNYHSHQNRDEVWVVTDGRGKTIIDGMEQEVHTGDVAVMEAGSRHTVIAETQLQLIEVQLGKEISVHDKKKYIMDK